MDHGDYMVIDAVDFVAETLTGALVYGVKDDKIGTVSQVHGIGTASQIVVDVGGFLGIGAKPVLLPVKGLTFLRDTEGSVHTMTEWTREQVKAMPEHRDH